MQKIYRSLLSVLSVVSVLLTACNIRDDDFDPHQYGLGEELFHNRYEFQLELAVQGGRGRALNIGGFHTLFVPVNEAWQARLLQGKDLYNFESTGGPSVFNNQAEARFYHDLYFIENESIAPDQLGGREIVNKAGQPLTVSPDGTRVTYNGQTANITRHITAANGHIYEIDRAFTPAGFIDQTLLEYISSRSDLSLLSRALERNPVIPSVGVYALDSEALPVVGRVASVATNVPVKEVLTGGKNYWSYTVYAPNNATFQAYLDQRGYASVDAVPDAELRTFLFNHIFKGTVPATSVTANQISLNGVARRLPSADNAIEKDIRTLTGRIHIVNALVQ